MTDKLHFKTVAAANLFKEEITGQLSDGTWENTRPLDHWRYWCNAEVVVDFKPCHEGWPMKTNYNLYSLKKYVKDQLLNAIRITKMPWFSIEKYGSLTRTLTDKCYLKFMPSCLEYKNVETSPEYIKEHFKWSVESKFNKAIAAIGPNCSEEFMKMIEDEIIRQMIENDVKHAENYNKYVDENRLKLAEIGVVDEESFHKMIETINDVEVTDSELNAALDEVKEMMTTAA